MVIDDPISPKKPVDAQKLSIYVDDKFKVNKQKSQAHMVTGPLDRFGAFLIDVFSVLMPLTALITSPLKRDLATAHLINQSESSILLLTISFLLMIFVVVVLYQTLMVWRFGATVGKLFFGLRVVNVWSHTKPTFYQSFVRALLWVSEGFLFFLPNLAVMSNAKRRSFHDRVVETIVVSTKAKRPVPPNAFEQAIARGGYAALITFFGLLFLGQAIKFSDVLKSDDFLESQYKAGRLLCDEVDTELLSLKENKSSKKLERLNLAMSLYAAGEIDEECLEKEVDYALELGSNLPLSYLAKSFVYKDATDISNKYLTRVCEEDKKSTSCMLSEAIQTWEPEKWQRITDHIQKSPGGSDFLNIWAIQYSYKSGHFRTAMNLVENTKVAGSLANYLGGMRAKVYFGLDQLIEAKVAKRFAYDYLNEEDKVSLAGWFCLHELQNSCQGQADSSCKILNQAIQEDSEYLSQEVNALAYIKSNECKGKISYRKMQGRMPLADGRLLLEALNVGQDGDLQRENQILLHIVKDQRVHEDFRLEALQRLFEENSKNQFSQFTAAQLVDLWIGQEKGLRWKNLGRKILSDLLKKQKNQESLALGEKLRAYQNAHYLPSLEIDKQTAKAAYRLRKFDLAWEILKQDISQSGSLGTPRGLASTKEIDSIYRKLKKQFGEP